MIVDGVGNNMATGKSSQLDTEELKKWFPALLRSGKRTETERDGAVGDSAAYLSSLPRRVKMIVICFPNAGSDESMYTNEGNGKRKIVSPLLEWASKPFVDKSQCQGMNSNGSHCSKDIDEYLHSKLSLSASGMTTHLSNAAIFAVQLPGRGMRSREPVFTSAQSIAKVLVNLLAPLLFTNNLKSAHAQNHSSHGEQPKNDADNGSGSSRDVDLPYAVIGHSLGALLAFEFISQCRDLGFPLPVHAFLSSFPAPDTPVEARPWRVNRYLNDEEFQQESKQWQKANDIIFSKGIWPTIEPQLRADFTLFDTYDFKRDTDEKLDCNATFFYAKHDQRVTRSLMENWNRRFSERGIKQGKGESMNGDEFLQVINGNHLFPISEPAAKVEWLSRITAILRAYK